MADRAYTLSTPPPLWFGVPGLEQVCQMLLPFLPSHAQGPSASQAPLMTVLICVFRISSWAIRLLHGLGQVSCVLSASVLLSIKWGHGLAC